MLSLPFRVFPKCLENKIRNKNWYKIFTAKERKEQNTFSRKITVLYHALLSSCKQTTACELSLNYSNYDLTKAEIIDSKSSSLFVLFHPLKSTGHSKVFNREISYLLYSMQVINNQKLWNILVLSPSVPNHKQQRIQCFAWVPRLKRFLLAIYNLRDRASKITGDLYDYLLHPRALTDSWMQAILGCCCCYCWNCSW